MMSPAHMSPITRSWYFLNSTTVRRNREHNNVRCFDVNRHYNFQGRVKTPAPYHTGPVTVVDKRMEILLCLFRGYNHGVGSEIKVLKTIKTFTFTSTLVEHNIGNDTVSLVARQIVTMYSI